jgi:ATP-dependent RNA helicase DeaD
LDVIKRLLKETLDLGRDDVFKVDVRFSFFNTDPEHTDKVMEVLNNVQLEGRRINVEISKMMVAEDVIITEEVLVVVLVVEEVQLQEEKETPRREGSGGGFRSDRSAQEWFWRKKFSST